MSLVKKPDKRVRPHDFWIHFWCGFVVGAFVGAWIGSQIFESRIAIAASGVAIACVIAYSCGIWGNEAWEVIISLLFYM
jgi:hypothetical protein